MHLAVRQLSPASTAELKRHVSHLNASWHTQARVVLRVWMSHGTHTYRNWLLPRMSESCHTYAGTEKMFFEWKCHGTHQHESCRAYEWVMPHTYMNLLGRWCRHLHIQELTAAMVSFDEWVVQHSAANCDTATHCNTLQHTASHCNTWTYCCGSVVRWMGRATRCDTLHHAATHCNALQHAVTPCSTLQHAATHCNTWMSDCIHWQEPSATILLFDEWVVQHSATHRNTLQQHTAIHCIRCNTLQ